jgi:hypothetical protein
MVKPVPQSKAESIDMGGFPIFDVEVEEECVSLGDSIKLRFRVAPEVKTRGVLLELRSEEHAVAKRQKSKKDWTLASHFIPNVELARDVWMNAELHTDESMPVSFDGQIVESGVSVKVTLDIPWARDKSVVIPIQLGHYSPAFDDNQKRPSEFRWTIK